MYVDTNKTCSCTKSYFGYKIMVTMVPVVQLLPKTISILVTMVQLIKVLQLVTIY